MAKKPEIWPPAPSAAAPWQVRRLPSARTNRVEVFRVREVGLWGRKVLINEDDEVYCPDCWEFLSTSVLSALDNSHRVGIAGVAEGIVPSTEDATGITRVERW